MLQGLRLPYGVAMQESLAQAEAECCSCDIPRIAFTGYISVHILN